MFFDCRPEIFAEPLQTRWLQALSTAHSNSMRGRNAEFQPDFLKIEKDPVADSITIPLKPTKDGSESYVTTIEVRKGPVDLPAKVAREEVEEQTRKARKRKEEEYNPPPARTPRRSSESGGYGYVRVSG